MILADANIWIYYLDATTDEHSRVAKEMDRALRERLLLTPTLVQGEVLHYIARQMGDQGGSAADALMAAPYEVTSLVPGTMDRARKLLMKHRHRGIGSRDAVILEHAREHGATILTHDQALFRMAIHLGLDAHDPALEAPA